MGREWENYLPFIFFFSLTIGFIEMEEEIESMPLTMGRNLENALPFVFSLIKIFKERKKLLIFNCYIYIYIYSCGFSIQLKECIFLKKSTSSISKLKYS